MLNTASLVSNLPEIITKKYSKKVYECSTDTKHEKLLQESSEDEQDDGLLEFYIAWGRAGSSASASAFTPVLSAQRLIENTVVQN